jgi:hypothetical protein
MFRRLRHFALVPVCGFLLGTFPVSAADIVLLGEDFEGSASTWTLTGDWQVGTPSSGPSMAYQGTRCAATNLSGYYNSYETAFLTSPSFNVPAASQVTLSYFDWLSISSYDYAYVQVSTDGGSLWTTLSTATYNAVWTRRNIDLTSYQNKNIRLRYYLNSSNGGYYGWYVDSVTVRATVIDTANAPRIAVAPSSFTLHGAPSVTQELTICNDGRLDPLSYSIGVSGALGTPSIVSWTYGSNLSTDYINVENIIYSKFSSARITRTTTTDSATLRTLLATASVFLIPRQASTTSTIGLAFARVLNDFVARGGIVIVLYPYAITTFLNYAGLDSSSYASSTSSSGYTVTVNAPSNPIFNNVSTSSLTTAYYISYWTPTGAYTLLASYSSYAVATSRKKGLGTIYTLGPDFYSMPTLWPTILTNCIGQASSSAPGVSVDTGIGTILSGACKKVSIGFNTTAFVAGTYFFTVGVTHNSILRTSPIAIPCTLTVDSATATVVRPSLNAAIFTGDSAIRKVRIINNGPSIINVTALPAPASAAGHLRGTLDSSAIHTGDTATFTLRFDATWMIDSGRYLDTFRVTHNGKGAPNPLVLICTLAVTSNVPVLIPYQPDPTINRRPALKWHKVSTAGSYTLSISSTADFLSPVLIQQTADTFFTPLADLPLGWKYWRVRTDLNMVYSHPDTLFLQKDSIPLLIRLDSDTIDGAGLVLRWHPAKGAKQYRIQLDKNDFPTSPIVISFTQDTTFPVAVNLAKGRYVWTISADFDYTQSATPDTFYSRGLTSTNNDAISLLTGPTDWSMAMTVKPATRSAYLRLAVPAQGKGDFAARRVSVVLYDAHGRRLATIVDGLMTPGISYHQVGITAIGKGMFFLRLHSGEVSRAERVLIVR